MKNRLLAVLALAVALAFHVSPLMADHGDQDDHGNPHAHGNPHGNPHGDHDNGHGWEKRGKYEYRTYAKGSVPPGWNQGKKTGWGDCGMPPGQAKKYGCRTYVYQGVPYYYYQDTVGQLIVRRPTVEVNGSVVIH